MPQSLAQVYLHLVFSTKNRELFLQDRKLRGQTHAYLTGICKNLESPSLITGGPNDHVHILCTLSRKMTMSSLIAELKRDSSKWIKAQDPTLFGFRLDRKRSPGFHWQGGYGAFSVSPSHIDNLKRYIANQEAHHQRETFQDEFRRLLRKYGMEYDERYVWD